MASMLDNGDDCLVEVPIRLSLAEIERLIRMVDRARRSDIMSSPLPTAEVSSERLATFARFILAMRRHRENVFPLVEFGEPAWDMLLDLYVQHVEGHKVSVSSLCTAAAVPPTTALRWMDAMVGRGHFIRSHDPNDGRRVHVGLSPAMISGIESFLVDMRHRALAALR